MSNFIDKCTFYIITVTSYILIGVHMKLFLYLLILILFICSNIASIFILNGKVDGFWLWYASANLAGTFVFSPLIGALFFFYFPVKKK